MCYEFRYEHRSMMKNTAPIHLNTVSYWNTENISTGLGPASQPPSLLLGRSHLSPWPWPGGCTALGLPGPGCGWGWAGRWRRGWRSLPHSRRSACSSAGRWLPGRRLWPPPGADTQKQAPFVTGARTTPTRSRIESDANKFLEKKGVDVRMFFGTRSCTTPPAPLSLDNTLGIRLYTTGLIREFKCICRLISLKIYGLKKLNLDYFYYYHWNQTF